MCGGGEPSLGLQISFSRAQCIRTNMRYHDALKYTKQTTSVLVSSAAASSCILFSLVFFCGGSKGGLQHSLPAWVTTKRKLIGYSMPRPAEKRFIMELFKLDGSGCMTWSLCLTHTDRLHLFDPLRFKRNQRRTCRLPGEKKKKKQHAASRRNELHK